jgi:Cu/Ag efflux pump CusA
MNAIVLIALKRPYTFVVLAILILVFGGRAAMRTPTDIFPNIGIPVVAVVWTYNGLTPEDMSGRVVYYYERALTTTVSNIEHIESQSLYGRGIANRAKAVAGGHHAAPRTDIQRFLGAGTRSAGLLRPVDRRRAV